MIMKKYLILFLIIFVSACSSSGNIESVSALPKWYISPAQNNAQNLYGVGEGYSLDEATKASLKNLASKLMVSISSESTMLLEENKFYTNEQSRQQINETVEKMDFVNYQVSKSVQMGPKIYVETIIDRNAFINDQTQKLSELNKNMQDNYNNLGDKNIIEKYNQLVGINDMAIQAKSINYILSGLGSNSDKEKNLQQYNFYQKAYDGILQKIEFFIELNNSPKTIANVLGRAINNEKIKIVNFKTSNSNLVIIDVKTDLVENNIYGANIAKLKINFSLLSNLGKVLKSNSVEVTGNSVVSKNEAVNAAISQLSEKINHQGILKILGIKN